MRRFMLSFILLFVILCTGCGSDGAQSASGTENPAVEQGSFEENAGDTMLSSEEDSEAGEHGEGMQNVPDEDDIPDTTLPSEEDTEAESHDDAMTQEEASEWEDHVLLTVEAPLADGRTFTLEVVGKKRKYHYGVSEVRVYDGDMLLQTVFVAEGIVKNAIDTYSEEYVERVLPGISEELTVDEINSLPEDMKYTECWSIEDTIDVLDLNFDGNADFGLFGWAPNNTIPYYYWTWDEEEEQYRYIGICQGAKLDLEAGEVACDYKWDSAGRYATDYFRPDENGDLWMDRREIEDWNNILGWEYPELEVWVPQEGQQILISPFLDSNDTLVLVRREIPVTEVRKDGVHYFLEIWELEDGVLQMTSREEYDFE